MTKKDTRDSFIFYRSFFEAMQDLSSEHRLELYDAITQFSLDFKEPKLTGTSKGFWTLIKPQLEANIKRYYNGKQPKQKQKVSKTEAKGKQKVSKKQANKNVNVNDNPNINNNNNKETFIEAIAEESLKPLLAEWLEYRKDLKTEKQWIFQYGKLKGLSNPKLGVEHSIGNGYTGLFEPKQNTHSNKSNGIF